MQQVYLDGQLFPADQPLFTAANRAFRYGDAVFESIRVFQGRLPFLSYHLERLRKGLDLLSLSLPHLDADLLQKAIHSLLPPSANARVRVQVFRKGGGLYTPTTKEASLLIEYQLLDTGQYLFSKKGLRVGIARQTIQPAPWQTIKTANSLPYVLAAQERELAGLDDLLLFTPEGQLVEATAANVLLVQEKEVCVSPQGVQGVLQRVLLEQIFPTLGINTQIRSTKLADIQGATSILLSNSINGIRWVRQFMDQGYAPGPAESLINALNDLTHHYGTTEK